MPTRESLLAAGLVDFLEVTVFPAITGKASYAALFQDGAEFDLDLVELTVLDVSPQRRET